MIEEQFVSFDTAKMLKEAGFDVPCRGGYHVNRFRYEAPTQALAARWLREVHGIHVCTDVNASGWYYNLCKSDNGTHILWSSYQVPNGGGQWDSYEEAMEAGLQEAIKLIKK